MKNRRTFVTAASALAVSLSAGCLTHSIRSIAPDQAFDPQAAQALLAPGNANVSGEAFLRQAGGAIVTCAGGDVALIPATPYFSALLDNAFEGADFYEVYSSASPLPPIALADHPEAQRHATCDSQGRFQFRGLAGGDYYLVTKIVWCCGPYTSAQGGWLRKRITVGPAETAHVIVTL
ncbi:MAG: hypothetical protein QJR02_07330 [Sinobacteraceae bacterium]|nr:hypothetical protein [Nevskiaceae bacterium]